MGCRRLVSILFITSIFLGFGDEKKSRETNSLIPRRLVVVAHLLGGEVERSGGLIGN